jgi:hypothetical protein
MNKMEALRTVIRPKNNKIHLTLPKSFKNGTVEVIVLPVMDDESLILDSENLIPEKKIFQKLLMDAPIMSDEDYNDFLNKREHFNKWKTYA